MKRSTRIGELSQIIIYNVTILLDLLLVLQDMAVNVYIKLTHHFVCSLWLLVCIIAGSVAMLLMLCPLPVRAGIWNLARTKRDLQRPPPNAGRRDVCLTL